MNEMNAMRGFEGDKEIKNKKAASNNRTEYSEHTGEG